MKTNKIIIFVFTCFIVLPNLYSSTKITPKLESVKVYLRGAELIHKGKVKIEKGTNELILTGISRTLDPLSLQVGFENSSISILSLSYKDDYLETPKSSEFLEKIKDSIKIIDGQITDTWIETESVISEIELINSNKVLSGKDRAITSKELKEMVDYYADALPKLKKKQYQTDKLRNSLIEIKQRLEATLNNGLNNNEPEFQYIVNIKADNNCESSFFVKYFTNEASWTPYYDLRANSKTNEIQIATKANVNQNSYIDWKGVKLTLSTKNLKSNTIPRNDKVIVDLLQIGSISNVTNNTASGFKIRGSRLSEKHMVDGVEIGDKFTGGNGGNGKEFYPMVSSYSSEDPNAISITNLSETDFDGMLVEYQAEDEYTIPSDNKNYSVNISNKKSKAEFEFYALPKRSLDVFRIAKISNSGDNKLLSGNANIYYDGVYLGNTFIKSNQTDKELKISLGTDESLILKRELAQEFSEENFLGSKVEKKYGFKNTILNSKKDKVTIMIEDLVPVSLNDDITVENIDISGGEFDKEKGLIKWKIDLSPNESKELKTVYSITYPKDKKVIIQD